MGVGVDAVGGGDVLESVGLELVGFAAEFLEEGIGEELPAAVGESSDAAYGCAVAEEYELLGMGDGQGAEEDGVEQGEDGGVGSDAEGEREQGDGGEAGALEQAADAEANVLKEVVEGGFPAGGPDLVLDGGAAAGFFGGFAPGGFGGEAGALLGGGGGLEVGVELFVEFVVEAGLVEERFEAGDESG